MARHGEKADETSAAEEIEFPQAAFPVHGAADPHGVRPESREFASRSTSATAPGGSPPVMYSSLGL